MIFTWKKKPLERISGPQKAILTAVSLTNSRINRRIPENLTDFNCPVDRSEGEPQNPGAEVQGGIFKAQNRPLIVLAVPLGYGSVLLRPL
jgi:hypothetical protein